MKIERLSHLIISFIAWNFLGLMLYSCSGSAPSPTVKEINSTKSPTFMSDSVHAYTFFTPSATLKGECDPASQALEYSLDNKNWSTMSPGCVSSAFSITISLGSSERKYLYVRAKTKIGYTQPGEAIINQVIQNTTNSVFEFAHMTSIGGTNGTVNLHASINLNTTGANQTSANNNLYSNMIGVIYAH